MPVPLLAIAQMVIDLAVIIAMVAAIIAIAGVIKDFLVENLVDLLVDMPSFGYSFEGGRESGGVMFNTYKSFRDVVVWPMILLGALSWLVTGRFGHHIQAAIKSEQTEQSTVGVPDFMRPQSPLLKGGNVAKINIGSDAGEDPGHGQLAWFRPWFSGLPSKCALCVALLFIMPPLWDAAMGGSAWTANTILNPIYSGDDEYPCPRAWYVNGALDVSNPDLLAHHGSVQWLLMQDKTGELDAMCRPELRVRYMLEQWGGETKAIPPPLDRSGSFWEMLVSMGDNAGDWAMRGLGEFFINILLGVVKAQAVVMSGTAMIVSNIVVDVAIATIMVFMPFYMLLMLVPWEKIGGGTSVKPVLDTFAPAVLVSAMIYPLELAILFAVSSTLLVSLLQTDYGNNLVVVALPMVTLGAFSAVMGEVTGKFTAMIQTAQGGIGAAAGKLGGMGSAGVGGAGGVTGAAMGKAGGMKPGK